LSCCGLKIEKESGSAGKGVKDMKLEGSVNWRIYC